MDKVQDYPQSVFTTKACLQLRSCTEEEIAG